MGSTASQAARLAAPGLLAASVAVILAVAPGARQTAFEPVLEPRLCDWSNSSGRAISCFELVVAEDRRKPAGRKVRLPVVVFRATSARVGAPVLFINGGPGVHSSTAGSSATWWNRRIKQLSFLKGRDLIIYDQRGVGASKPALDCPGVKKTRRDPLNADLLRRVLTDCARRLRGQGINIASYNTAANVADIVDLRRALKIKIWNLWGQSYGSRVALEVMRRQPAGVRSVILDGPYPPQIGRKFNWAAPTLTTIGKILALCGEATGCKERLEDPRKRWVELLQRLHKSPVVTVSKPGGGLTPMSFRINDVMLMWVVQDSLYTGRGLRRLPSLIAALSQPKPDTRLLSRMVQDYDLNVYGPYYSHGAAYAVSCNDNPRPDQEDERQIARRHPHLKPWIEDMLSVDGCAIFAPGGKIMLNFEPVKSTIPTLIIAGGLDLATPPAWGKETAKHLPNSRLFVFANASHDVSDLPCAQIVMRAFLNRPEARPTHKCMAKPAAFSFDWRWLRSAQ